MKLLFISYINRSGSTFLANELSKYSSILVCPEAEVLVSNFIRRNEPFYIKPKKLHSLLSKILTQDPKLKYWNLKTTDFDDNNNYQNNFEIFLEILTKYRNQIKPEASIIIFKADTIAYLYKNIPKISFERYGIKFIFIIRDGRASYASQWITIGARKQKPINRNPIKAAKLWKKWITFYANHQMDPRFVFIQYENLIKNFHKQFHHLLVDILQITEVNKKEGVGDLFERIPLNQRQMHPNVIKSPIPANIDKWKQILPHIHITIFEMLTRRELMQMGYSLMYPKSNKIITLCAFVLYWILHLYQKSILRRLLRSLWRIL